MVSKLSRLIAGIGLKFSNGMSRLKSFYSLLFFCILLAACSKSEKETNEYVRHQTGEPTWIKLNENLILRVPEQYRQFWLIDKSSNNHKVIHSISQPVNLPVAQAFNFQMFMPDFKGYTTENYLNEFDENEVQIVSIAPAPMAYAEPNAPGTYPPNQLKRITNYLIDKSNTENRFGLTCYEQIRRPKESGQGQFCYGLRDKELNEYILLNVMNPPYADWIKYPIMQTTYFTKQYGGLEITWRSHMKNFSQWHEIDKKIWEYIKSWNVKKSSEAKQEVNIASD